MKRASDVEKKTDGDNVPAVEKFFWPAPAKMMRENLIQSHQEARVFKLAGIAMIAKALPVEPARSDGV